MKTVPIISADEAAEKISTGDVLIAGGFGRSGRRGFSLGGPDGGFSGNGLLQPAHYEDPGGVVTAEFLTYSDERQTVILL